MIAKARTVPNGINAILHVTGESLSAKRRENIWHVKNQFIPWYYCAEVIWDMMKFGAHEHRRMTNIIIRIELSPAREDTNDFTFDDWAELWDEYVEEFDRQELCDKNGHVISQPTHLKDSMASVWLHKDSRGGIPHLQAVVCRVDQKGNVNNDHNIHVRAQKAAELISKRRGWVISGDIRSDNIDRIVSECEEILRNMGTFRLQEFFALLSKKYDVILKRDDENRILGYSIKQGRAIYKASELGEKNLFTIPNLPTTWSHLHAPKDSDKSVTE